jgi:hypothetical protein
MSSNDLPEKRAAPLRFAWTPKRAFANEMVKKRSGLHSCCFQEFRCRSSSSFRAVLVIRWPKILLKFIGKLIIRETTKINCSSENGAHIGFVPPGKLFHWTEDSRILVRLRAFRKVAEETKNHDLERDLYIEERKAERGVSLRQLFEDLKKEPWKNWPRNAARLVAHLLWIAVMGIYWALADYGRSFVRPFAWLIASGFFFYWCYGKILAPLIPNAGPLADKYAHAVGMVALGNAVPFVGPLTIDAEIKKFLFCPGFGKCLPIPPEGFQLLVIAQNLFSITCVFFIGLALRNYFRIK